MTWRAHRLIEPRGRRAAGPCQGRPAGV